MTTTTPDSWVVRCDDTPSLLGLIQDHVAATREEVVCNDDSYKQVVGFIAKTKAWTLHITRLTGCSEGVRELFRSPTGRQELAQRLSAGERFV